MVVLCTIKKNWENIVLGMILCTYLVYFKIEIHKLPTPFCEYLASRANVCLVRGKPSFIHSGTFWYPLLGLSEGLPCNTLNRPLSLWISRLLLLWFLLLLRPISFGNKSFLILGIFVTDTCLFEAAFYTIIRLKLKYLFFLWNRYHQGWILHHLWEVLILVDSKAAARVSGAAETVDYFG